MEAAKAEAWPLEPGSVRRENRQSALPQPGTRINAWGLAIDAPLPLNDAEVHDWAGEADVVVVGLGGAGVSAALEGLERGLSVIALDHYDGGGSSAANGGVYYAGGGTSIQREAGVHDDPAMMEAYLRTEVGDVVPDHALRDFCEGSAETFEWLRRHHALFSATLHAKKTS